MTVEHFLNGRVTLHADDCMAALARLDECSIDSCVTDPPYHLTSIVKRFGADGAAPAKHGTDGAYARASAGFMGKVWDGGDIAFRPETWAEVYRVLKPGGYLLAFGGTRTYHRMACAIEDAGFEIRDTINWLYASGFPKSHDVSKGIDKAAGAERAVIGKERNYGTTTLDGGKVGYGDYAGAWDITAPATDAARKWQGWGTALKPACELIVLARKPLGESTVANNVLKWGTGAINVDGCRVGTEERTTSWAGNKGKFLEVEGGCGVTTATGRWPANVIHDGSDEVVAAFPETAPSTPGIRNNNNQGHEGWSGGTFRSGPLYSGDADSGSAARFFFSAKADADDRLGSRHPTVKPVDLMQYLCRLVTPPKGTVLDLFAGTGTTGEAAFREGFKAVLIEREFEYVEDIRRRMRLVFAGEDERTWESIKVRGRLESVDDLPLFGGLKVLAGPDERVRESVKARGTPIDYGPLFAAISRQEAAE